MGIPAAFRWLSNKYPKIISPVAEDKPIVMDDGSVIPVDTTQPNPNGEEFDNLYLDFNGIVHPCSHPEDRPAPKDEEEMMLEIFKYTERVVNMVRPRKVLMIAIDGVAPRAKMNQQRSRRFRSAQEAKEKEVEKLEFLKLLKKQNGGVLPPETIASMSKKAFDSNSITPGTPFMDVLAASMRYWCAYKLNTDASWATLKIIISDATVPGEGEHKIMNFIRSQRTSISHDPNTKHVIYGLDADLIMLGLATHEANFRVLREDVFFQEGKSAGCNLCGQMGHFARECKGKPAPVDDQGEPIEDKKEHPQKPFIWLHVPVLREYLAVELAVANLPFRFDLERAVDDWVFMCSFVGNDFLPHLPALEIREGGIDTLTAIWRENLPLMGGYMTKDGTVNFERAQYMLDGLAKQEDSIYRKRRQVDERREAGAKRRKMNQNQNGGGNQQPNFVQHQNLPPPPPKAVTHDMVINKAVTDDANIANKSAAAVLKAQIQGLMPESASATGKRKAELIAADDNEATPASDSATASTPAKADDKKPQPQDPSEDRVRLWEDGYADRYYEQKFHIDPKDGDFRRQVAWDYAKGLAWVLQYYYQGCPDWEWYYPYHYAPFAHDFKDLAKLTVEFKPGRISKPFEQLLSVQPAASKHVLPEIFHDLMTDPKSDIIDFYPEDFAIDLNGKKMAWQGVALLPFIEMPRLLAAAEKKYPLLTEAEATRNGTGHEVLLLSESHAALYDSIISAFYSKKAQAQGGDDKPKLDPKLAQGLAGKIEMLSQDEYLPHGELKYPLERAPFENVDDDRSITVVYELPQSGHAHKSMLLRGAKPPQAKLSRSDVEELKGKIRNPGRGDYRGGGRGGNHYGGGGRGGGGHYNNNSNNNNNNNNNKNNHYNNGHHGGNNNNSNNGFRPPPPAANGIPVPPPGWVPPPGFASMPFPAQGGMSLPPPPPPTHYHGGSGNGNGYYGGGNRGGGGGNGRGGSGGGRGGGGRGGNHYHQQQQHYPPPPPQQYHGQNQGYNNSYGGHHAAPHQQGGRRGGRY